MKIILASQSPRRTEILTLANIKHTVVPSKCEEIINPNDLPYQVVESLSYQKAQDVFKNHNDSIVIGSDTIVVIDNVILGKPHSYDEAINMLQMLSGKAHQVITGVTIMSKDLVKTFHEVTDVHISTLSLEQIKEYIDSENVYDKAGSYAIQGTFCKYITKLVGDYYNVVGLPIARVFQELKEYNNEI